MHVDILLEPKPYYTAQDAVSGQVIVSTTYGTDCEEIVVKLEVESISRVVRTQLNAPTGHGAGSATDEYMGGARFTEMHKTLYRTEKLWPSDELVESQLSSDLPFRGIKLPAGEHVFPFRLRFPSENTCSIADHVSPILARDGKVERLIPPMSHARRPLPPPLAMGAMAEIRYFVKVTVKRLPFRTQRVEKPLRYIPPGLPSPAAAARSRKYVTQSLSIASSRRQQQQHPGAHPQPPPPPQPSTKGGPAQLPTFNIRASLAPGGQFQRGSPLDLRLEIEQAMSQTLGSSAPPPPRGQLSLEALGLTIVSNTRLLSDGCEANESDTYVPFTRSGLGIPIGSPSDRPETSVAVPASLWERHLALPDRLVPSFRTCNIERSYVLEISMTLKHQPLQPGPDGSVPPLSTRYLSMVVPFEVVSGIAPPPPPQTSGRAEAAGKRATNGTGFGSPAGGRTRISSNPQPRPGYDGGGRAEQPARPARHRNSVVTFEEPPPSYDEAVRGTARVSFPPLPDHHLDRQASVSSHSQSHSQSQSQSRPQTRTQQAQTTEGPSSHDPDGDTGPPLPPRRKAVQFAEK